MKIQNIIKFLWKINFGAKIFKTEESTNGHELKMAVGSSQPKGGPSGPTSSAAAPGLPDVAAALAPPTAPSLCSHPLQLVIHVYKRRELGLSSPQPHTLHFHSLSHSFAPSLAKIFFHKAQEQGNSTKISQAHHHKAKLVGCSICFH